MKYYVDDQTEVHVAGGTVSQALTDLTTRYPAITTHILDSRGRLRRHVNLFVNKENIQALKGIDTPLKESDKIILLASISGG